MAHWDIDDEWDRNVFTWKIPGVSSIPHVVGYAVRSPPFVFGGTTWTMKMFPNGDAQQNEGHISVTIERSNTQGEGHCFLSYKDNSNKEIELYTEIPNSEKKVSIPRLMRNLKESSQDPDIVINDTFYLVLDLRLYKECSDECSFPTKSDAETVGRTDGNENVTGAIFKEYEGSKQFFYKISDIPRGLSSDYHIESPRFSFLNATWILKLWPYYRMQNSQNQNVELVLERLESEAPVHNVELIIDCYPYIPRKEKSISFAPSQTQSPAIIFQLEDPNETELEIDVEIKVLKTSIVLLEPQNNSVEKAAASLADPYESKVPSSELGESSTSGSNSIHNDSKVLNDYKELFLKKENYDVVINVQGVEFQAHQLILQARSPVLASTFRSNMKEKATGVIEIEDCEPSSFSDFLCFLYCGEVLHLSKENVFSLFYTADKYDVQDLRAKCINFMKENLCVDTFCETISLALRHSEKELLKLTTDFFIKNAPSIILTVQWQTFLAENPTESNELFVKLLVPNSSN